MPSPRHFAEDAACGLLSSHFDPIVYEWRSWCTKKNCRAVITGASSGIGAVYADRLAHRGYDLLLVARSQAPMVDLAKKIESDTGSKVDILVADLRKSADVAKLEQILREDSRVTLLVNNAGGELRPAVSGGYPPLPSPDL
jgi:short-subunit dehydrogenase